MYAIGSASVVYMTIRIFPTTRIPYSSPVNRPTHKGLLTQTLTERDGIALLQNSHITCAATNNATAVVGSWIEGRRRGNDTEHTKIAPETAAAPPHAMTDGEFGRQLA